MIRKIFFLFSFPWFIYSFISVWIVHISVWTHGFLYYLMDSNLLLFIIYFDARNCARFGQWKPLQAFFCFLLGKYPFFSLDHSFQNWFLGSCPCPASTLGIIHFSWELRFLSVEDAVWKPRSGCLVGSLPLERHCFWTLSADKAFYWLAAVALDTTDTGISSSL